MELITDMYTIKHIIDENMHFNCYVRFSQSCICWLIPWLVLPTLIPMGYPTGVTTFVVWTWCQFVRSAPTLLSMSRSILHDVFKFTVIRWWNVEELFHHGRVLGESELVKLPAESEELTLNQGGMRNMAVISVGPSPTSTLHTQTHHEFRSATTIQTRLINARLIGMCLCRWIKTSQEVKQPK